MKWFNIDMIDLASSLVESYMYADMYNREYDGGSGNMNEKAYSAGVPVEYVLPSLKTEHPEKHQSDHQDGGQKCKGPFTNKVVPVGLILIETRKDPDVEYDDHFFPGENREVIPDALYEMLMGSVMHKKEPAMKKRITPMKKRLVKDRSRKKR
jgi:hypothetical protein